MNAAMRKSMEIAVVSSCRIGDQVVLQPFLRELSRRYPGGRVVLITNRGENTEILDAQGIVTEVIETGNGRLAVMKNLAGLIRRKFDLLVNGLPFNTPGERLYFRALRSSRKISCIGGDRPAHMMWLEALCKVFPGPLPQTGLFEDMRAFAGGGSGDIGGLDGIDTGRLIGIHAHSPNWATTSWRTDRWKELVRRIGEKYMAKVVVLGGKDDAANAAEIASAPGTRSAVCLSGRLTLRQTAAVLCRLDALVCINSGLMNMASALDVPLVCLSGPSADMWRPFGARSVEIKKRIDRRGCAPPCNDPSCSWGDLRCMEGISVDEVMEGLSMVLGLAGRA